MRVGKVGVARRGPMPLVAEDFPDQGEVLACHDGLAGCGMAQIVQAQSAEPGIDADRALVGREAVGAMAFGVAREQERIWLARAGQRGDVRALGFAEPQGARVSLRVAEPDRGFAEVAPAKIEQLAAAAAG